MIHRSVPGIGPYVLPAFIFAAVPALLAALAYGSLSSAMPRAGGSYIYASRGLHPYLGFVASFSQWFGLSIVIGVIAYVIVPFIRDVFVELEWSVAANTLEIGWVRVSLALLMIWSFIYINIRGGKFYERTVVPLMFIMFLLGAIVIVTGFVFDQNDFQEALFLNGKESFSSTNVPFNWKSFLFASAVLFSSFIGFDAIAQAGGEAKKPNRNLPLAIILAITIVGSFYFLFTTAVYNTVPWSYVAQEALIRDISAPGLLGLVIPAGLAVFILIGAAIALINDLPAMLLSVSRLMFSWAEDGIFPKSVSRIHPRYNTPVVALYLSGLMASVGVLGSHFAGDFFLGIDIMVTSMMVNFLLMCVTLIFIPKTNPTLSSAITMIRSANLRFIIGLTGSMLLVGFLIVHTWKDLSSDVSAWYFHSTYVWLIVMIVASGIFFLKLSALKKSGENISELFSKLPEE